jgi:23S rRNA (cytidine1920-2'-O)/16S rRNA (cytidine1409-2'-O)-methyltransferase
MSFVSRGGEKLEFALKSFSVNPASMICADFGSSTGGFVDCLLQNGAIKVYAVETGYGVLDWKLRNDPRVVVLERLNAMHIELPEKADLITIDTSWTKLEKTVPNALKNLKPDGKIIALLKPHYEAGRNRLDQDKIKEVVGATIEQILKLGVELIFQIESPILGEKGGNREFLLLLKPK